MKPADATTSVMFHLEDGSNMETEIIPVVGYPGRVLLRFSTSRVNLHFAGTPAEIREQVIDALSNQLGAYEDTLRERGMGFADAFADDEPVVVPV